MIVDRIDTLYVPDVMQLTKPIEFIEVKYEGKVLTARFHDIEVITFGKGQDTTSSTITIVPRRKVPLQNHLLLLQRLSRLQRCLY